jgi:hypothetical protein
MAVARERLGKQMSVAKQWLGERHMIAATVTHAKIAELLEVPFSIGSVPAEDSLELQWRVSLQSAERVRGWHKMVASLQGRQPGRRGTSNVGSRYRAT